jgi:hypothetical protein
MSYSLDWPPPAFTSRTSNPADPCFVGRVVIAAATPKRNGPGLHVRRKSRTWDLWCLLVKRGEPMTASEIALNLNCTTKLVGGNAGRLLQHQAVVTRYVGGRLEYSVGPTPVVGV